jgi:CubicO group peptidase (beta-lactamase class C family)
LDQFITRNYPLFSGSVLVARQGELLLSRGYKYADWELEVANTPGTKFRIASLTKPFTATAIMLLRERGLLDVEDRVCRFLAGCPASWRPITIHQLLTHTSGIPDYTALPGAFEEAVSPHSVSELIESFQDEPLEFTPGESFLYSNSGYVLLGAVIEEVTRSEFAEFVTYNLLLPFGLKDTGYDRASEVLKGRASGYNIVGNAFVNAPYLDMSNAYAAGGLYSTVEDLYRWEQVLVAGQLLSQESLDLMLTPHVDAEAFGTDYGYGWLIGVKDGRRMIGHGGGLPGFHSFLEYFPDDEVSIIVLSNIETTDVNALASGLETTVFAGR